jgi:predicted DNA-binding mobile mystery protein A
MPAKGWLRAVREAIGLTQSAVAGKIGVRRQSYAQFEAAEELGSISIASMRRAADAMGCELVYFILPREAVAATYSDLACANDPVSVHMRATDQSMALKGQGGQDHVH